MNNVTLEEAFRKFAIEYGFADEIVIKISSSGAYSELTGITGCFQSENGEWVVYETDERGAIFNIERCASQKKAFIEVAKRFGVEDECKRVLETIVDLDG